MLLLGITTGCSSKKENPYVVIISFDGFRYNYNDSIELPNFNDIAKNGVKAEWMIPVFPTVTYPNHYAIATGLYPEHNGIANNKFYNSTLGKEYNSTNEKITSDRSFYRGNPLWNFLQDHGIKTATCNWVGSDALINGKQANFKVNDSSLTDKNRVDSIIRWLQLPDIQRPHFIMAYFPQPDDAGHEFGPFHKQTLAKVQEMDSLVGYFRGQLQKLTFGKEVNIIILSDHGMAVADSAKNIFIPKKAADQFFDRTEGGTQNVFVYAKKGQQDKLIDYLCNYKHINFISRKNFPKNWHLNDTTTVPDLILLADESYNIHIQGENPKKGGCHGYDNTLQSMQTIFYACGPEFKFMYTQKPFENVDIFPLICKIYSIQPPVVDGKIEDVEGMLVTKQ
jgi:alkaline phosphatase D